MNAVEEKTWRRYSALQPEELDCLAEMASLSSSGDILCAGIWKGGDVIEISRARRNRQQKILAIDSFQGLAEPSEHDIAGKGEMYSTLDVFDNNISEFGVSNLHVYPMWITERNISFIEQRDLALVWLDLDHYLPTLLCMNRFYPWLLKGCWMLTHDYDFHRTPGIRKAAQQHGGNWQHLAGGIFGKIKGD